MAFLNYVYNIIMWIITSHGSLYLYLYGLFWSNKILYIISDNDESPRHLDYLPACCKSHRDKCMFKIQPSSHPKQPYPFELNSTSCKLLAITVLCSFALWNPATFGQLKWRTRGGSSRMFWCGDHQQTKPTPNATITTIPTIYNQWCQMKFKKVGHVFSPII